MNPTELAAAAAAVEAVAEKHGVSWYFNESNYEEIATAAVSAYIVAHGKALQQAANTSAAKSVANKNPPKPNQD